VTPRPLDQRFADHQRPYYLPLVFALSMRIENVTWDELRDDGALVALALRGGLSAFHADGLVNWFDPWLEAEAMGLGLVRDETGRVQEVEGPIQQMPSAERFSVSGGIPAAIDVARRLTGELGDRGAVLGYLTGGTTIIEKCFGEEYRKRIASVENVSDLASEDLGLLEAAVQCSVHLAREYCECGVAALLMAEESPPTPVVLSAYEPVFNLAAYYALPVVIVHKEPIPQAAVTRYADIGGRSVLLPSPDGAEPGDCLALPLSVFHGQQEGGTASCEPVAELTRPAKLITTSWDIPPDTNPERVALVGHRVVG